MMEHSPLIFVSLSFPFGSPQAATVEKSLWGGCFQLRSGVQGKPAYRSAAKSCPHERGAWRRLVSGGKVGGLSGNTCPLFPRRCLKATGETSPPPAGRRSGGWGKARRPAGAEEEWAAPSLPGPRTGKSPPVPQAFPSLAHPPPELPFQSSNLHPFPKPQATVSPACQGFSGSVCERISGLAIFTDFHPPPISWVFCFIVFRGTSQPQMASFILQTPPTLASTDPEPCTARASGPKRLAQGNVFSFSIFP